MKLTTDDSTLITCSVDGSICVWKVRDADQEKSTTFPDDVIISRREFKRKLETVTALESRLDQLTVQIVIDTAELSKTYGKRIQDLDEMRSSIMERDERHLQEMIALHDTCKTSLENRINDMSVKHELDMKTAKEDYEKKLIYEDIKVANLKENMRDMDEDIKKKKEMIIKECREQIEALADRLSKEVKEKEDTFEKFKEQFDKEKKLLGEELDEFDDQCDRDVLRLRTSFGPKIKKFSDLCKKLQKEICVFEAKIRTANQTIGDLNRLNEKYRNDVKKMKSLERTLEITIVDEKNELLRFDKASQDKDACIRVIQSNINNFETEISALRLKEERQKNVMESLIRTDAPLGEIINDIETLFDCMNKAAKPIEFENSKLKSTIKAINLDIKKVDKEIHENKTLVKKINIDIHLVHLEGNHDVSTFFTYLYNNLHYKHNIRNSDCMLFKQRRYLERRRAYLETRYAASARRKPPHIKKAKENGILIALADKLKRDVAINQKRYQEQLITNMLSKNSTVAMDPKSSVDSFELKHSHNQKN